MDKTGNQLDRIQLNHSEPAESRTSGEQNPRRAEPAESRTRGEQNPLRALGRNPPDQTPQTRPPRPDPPDQTLSSDQTLTRQPTSEADEDRGIAASLEDATEEEAAEEGAEIAASLEDAEIAASLEDAAEDNAEIAASLEDAAEEDAHQTAGLQHLKPASQPERSSGKRKAKSHGGQAGVKTGRRTRSLERSGALSENESEMDFNEYQEVTMENVQQPVGESVEFPGKFVRKGMPP
ncbi:unnamed protein product [Gadus morhua 'NCC']